MTTVKLEAQFDSTATLLPLPRAFRLNNSGVIKNAIDPAPIEKKII